MSASQRAESGNATIAELRAQYLSGEVIPAQVVQAALERANGNAGRNTYITLLAEQAMAEAEELPQRFPDPAARPLLYGVPVSVKDCFDVAGTVMTAGTKLYAQKNAPATKDSVLVTRLRGLGAVIIGKTNLHPVAYGITGENPDYGDCLQPRDAALLTGGSSSGAAASVQEGSALAAIGTDTGGSVRTPAALCGVVGYRASHGLAEPLLLWSGGMHLAKSFDTPGWLFRSAVDAPLLGEALLGLKVPDQVRAAMRIGVASDNFLRDCEPAVRAMYAEMRERFAAAGAIFKEMDTAFWQFGVEIFAPIQANEAAAIHHDAGGEEFSNFPREIAERLKWGESFPPEKLQELRFAHTKFRMRVDTYFDQYDFVLLPCGPLAQLRAGDDHSKTRPRLLRYTVPFSLGGNPVVALPGAVGGVQLVGARGADAKLLRYAAQVWPQLYQ